jgi:hypoxanthine phosphoribosyltransferase
VYYAFSYKPSDKPGGSTDLLKSLKGNGPFKLTDARREKFLNDATEHMADQFRRMRIAPEVIVAPQSSSPLLHDFATALADKLNVTARKIGAFKKSKPIDLPGDREEAYAKINKNYIDHEYVSQKFTGDAAARAAMERQLEQAVYRSIKAHGCIVAKELPKMFGKFVKNIVAPELDDEYSLMDKSVMIIDDVMSSGTTMSDMFRAVADLGAGKTWGATLFARSSTVKEATGDKGFDDMMGNIEKKAKDGVAFHTKVRDAVESIPGVFKRQAELEKWMATELQRIQDSTDKMFEKYRKALGPITKWFNDRVSIMNMFETIISCQGNPRELDSLGLNEKKAKAAVEFAGDFLDDHRDDIEDVLVSWGHSLEKLKQEANAEKWPVPWSRYTNYSQYKSDYENASKTFKKYWNSK